MGGGFSGLPISINGAVLGYQGGAIPWVQPPRYWYGTYRIMRLHPTLTIARNAVLDPIRANQWTIKGKQQDTNPDWIKFVSDQVLLQRSTVISHCLTAPEFGCAAFEKRWKIVDGKRVITLFPLKIEWTTIYTTPTGEFAGIINMPSSSGIGGSAYMPNELLGPQYSLVVTHDMDAGNLCGQSRYEAAYDAWCDWQWTRLDMAKLRGKLANIIPMLKFPPGSTMLNGKDVDNAIIAQNILSNLGSGRGVALPSVDFSTDAIQDNPKLASTSLWELTFYDAGTYSAAQAGMIETSKYYDNMMAYAWKIRPQQIFDAQNGTKAQAGTHTDSASVDPEQLDNEIAEQLNRQWVDDILLHNFGPDAVGQVFIKPQPLSNPTVEFKQTMISALISSKDPEVISNLDVKTLMQESELPVLDTPKPIPEQPVADGANPAARPMAGDKADKPDKADPATAMLSRWIEGDVFELGNFSALEAGEHWRTIEGEHVLIRGGKIEKGPSNLVGKSVDSLPARSSKVGNESSYHSAKTQGKAAADDVPMRLRTDHFNHVLDSIDRGDNIVGIRSAIETSRGGLNEEQKQFLNDKLKSLAPPEPVARINTPEQAKAQSAKFNEEQGKKLAEARKLDRGSRSGKPAASADISPESDYAKNGTKAKAFKQWFGDWEGDKAGSSKVVNAKGEPAENFPTDSASKVTKEGKPVVVHHGTASSDFDAFDKSKVGNANLFGPGFYFTEDQGIAAEYQKKGGEISDEHLKSIIIPPEKRKAYYDEYAKTYKAGIGNRAYVDEASLKLDAKKSSFMASGTPHDLIKETYHAGLTGGRKDWETKTISALESKYGYVTNDKAGVKSAYLNIRNPLDLDKPATKADFEEVKKYAIDNNPKDYGLYFKHVHDNISDDKSVRGIGQDNKDVTWGNLQKLAKAHHKVTPALFTDPTGKTMSWQAMHRLLSDDGESARNTKSLSSYIGSKGYDGMTHTGGAILGQKPHKVWIAFEPNQIKSVANKGAFDAKSDNINLSLDGDVIEMSNDPLTGGEWRTINGAKIYIKDGSVAAGPRELLTKKTRDAAFSSTNGNLGSIGIASEHANAAKNVIDKMTDTAAARVLQNTDSFHYHAAAQNNGQTNIGGSYVHDQVSGTRELHVGGATKNADIEGVHAHEMMHAVDGESFEFSKSDE